MMKTLTYMFTCLLGVIQLAQAQKTKSVIAQDQGILWKVSGNGLTKPSYILGTFHLAVKPTDQLLDSCIKFIKTADFVYGEMDLNAAEENPQKLMTLGTLGDGAKLSDFYSAEDYKTVKQFMKDSLGMDEDMYILMKPMMVNMMISIMTLTKMSGMDDINYSVDKEIQNIAKKHNKNIMGFETMDEQADILFNQIPLAEQAIYLLQSITDGQFDKATMEILANDYRNGRIEQLGESLNKSMKGSFEDIFLVKRNQKWMKEILAQLGLKKKLFVAVGAGHLSGNMGLLKLLRQAGYTVKPVI